MSKALLECTMCRHVWSTAKVPKGYQPCPGCGKHISFYQTPTFFNLEDVSPGVSRVVDAARALAFAEESRRAVVAAVDWAQCERGYEDGRSVCAQEADDFEAPADSPLATYERCVTCERNRDYLTAVKGWKVARRNAINRVVRAVARLPHEGGAE